MLLRPFPAIFLCQILHNSLGFYFILFFARLQSPLTPPPGTVVFAAADEAGGAAALSSRLPLVENSSS